MKLPNRKISSTAVQHTSSTSVSSAIQFSSLDDTEKINAGKTNKQKNQTP